VASPLILLATGVEDIMSPRLENRVLWPILTAIAVIVATRKLHTARRPFSPQALALLGYLALAGASVFWAFSPELAFIRFAQQAMIVVSVVVPPMLTGRMPELMRGLHLCFAFAALLNIVFVFTGDVDRPHLDAPTEFGHPGYFVGKNLLGELAAVSLIFSIYEATYSGVRRAFACLVIIASVYLLIASHNKTSLGLIMVTPILAALIIAAVALTHISAAVILLYFAAVATVCYVAASETFGFNIDDVSLLLYDDPSFTGRTTIWAFAIEMIQRHPILGWGYQSFWLVGPDAPSIVEAPGWVATMPHAHNGYLDTMLETGFVGLVILLLFILATVHGIGRIAGREPRRAWLSLTLALFIIFTNGLETMFFHAYDMLWLVFLVLAAEPGHIR
jgi:hypothetical protein